MFVRFVHKVFLRTRYCMGIEVEPSAFQAGCFLVEIKWKHIALQPLLLALRLMKLQATIVYFFFQSALLVGFAQTPAQESFKKDVEFLASDKLKGREAGSADEKKAAAYVANRFKTIGLIPKGDQGTFFQEFDFTEKAHPHSTDQGKAKKGRNVVGYQDNGQQYTIIIGAHFDHLGMGAQGSLHAGKPEVHNGADDNASGVAMLLYLAEKLQTSKSFNYLYIAFSGEEKGLFGSSWYAKNPTIAMEQVTCMINMDMVGRYDADKGIAVYGIGTSPNWKSALDKANTGNLKLVIDESGIGPSDHTSFYLKDKPVLHFFTGQHSDYHKPSDDADKINYAGMEIVEQFIERILAEIPATNKLEFTKTKEQDSKKAPKFSVTLGVMPDYMFSGKGMRIDGIIEDRPGEKAGLLADDIILKIGEVEVVDMQSYMDGLSKFQKGDKAIVIYERDGITMKTEVQF